MWGKRGVSQKVVEGGIVKVQAPKAKEFSDLEKVEER